MKLLVVSAVAGLFFSLAGSISANTSKTEPAPGEKTERAIPVSPQLTVTLCVASGTLTVKGSDKNELRVTSSAKVIEFRRIDKPRDPAAAPSRIDVMLFETAARVTPKIDCQTVADVDMEVPAGASVLVQTRDGDISINGVAAAYAGSQNGNIEIERATRLVEAGSVGGSISLRDSTGRVSLSSAGGIVEAANVKAANTDDTFEVGTVSGDIQLDRVSSPKVMAKTVNGTVTMLGPLTKSGVYTFTNMTGDVVLGLPHDASFKLNAKVSEKRDIVSDFALKYLPETPPPAVAPPAHPPAVPKPGAIPGAVGPAAAGGPTGQVGPGGHVGPGSSVGSIPKKPAPAVVAKGHTGQKQGTVITTAPAEKPALAVPYILRVNAICGSGDATIVVASFGGTVRLKKL
jgi:Putative adhesin